MELSARITSLKASSTVAVMNKAKALRAAGVDVLNFSAGEPDFPSPAVAVEAACAALREGHTKYIDAAGDPQTRDLLASIITAGGIPGVTRDHVLVTAGVKMALYLTFQGLFDQRPAGQEQELLLPVPAWVSFAPMAQLAGAKVVELPTTPEGDFKITPAQLRAAITPRTRAVLINSPSNPASTMYTRDELAALADVVAQAAATVAPQIVIVADELYQHIVFGGVPHHSIGSFPQVAERTLTINGPGKSFAMTGWRLGWVSGSGGFGKAFIAGLTKLQGQSVTCVPGYALAGMRAALTQAGPDLAAMRAAFAQRAEVMYTGLLRLPGIKAARPIGAFYVFPDISAHLGKTSAGGVRLSSAADFAAALLQEQQMAVVPGEDFSSTMGHRHIRMSFACSTDQIRTGLERLGAFILGLH